MLKFEEEDTNFDGLKNLNDESFFASVILSFCHFVMPDDAKWGHHDVVHNWHPTEVRNC